MRRIPLTAVVALFLVSMLAFPGCGSHKTPPTPQLSDSEGPYLHNRSLSVVVDLMKRNPQLRDDTLVTTMLNAIIKTYDQAEHARQTRDLLFMQMLQHQAETSAKMLERYVQTLTERPTPTIRSVPQSGQYPEPSNRRAKSSGLPSIIPIRVKIEDWVIVESEYNANVELVKLGERYRGNSVVAVLQDLQSGAEYEMALPQQQKGVAFAYARLVGNGTR